MVSEELKQKYEELYKKHVNMYLEDNVEAIMNFNDFVEMNEQLINDGMLG